MPESGTLGEAAWLARRAGFILGESGPPLGAEAEEMVKEFLEKYGENGRIVLDMFNAINHHGYYLADPVNKAVYVEYAKRFMDKWDSLPQWNLFGTPDPALKRFVECMLKAVRVK